MSRVDESDESHTSSSVTTSMNLGLVVSESLVNAKNGPVMQNNVLYPCGILQLFVSVDRQTDNLNAPRPQESHIYGHH